MPQLSTLSERFWSKVDVRGPDECWPWLGTPDRDGYGRLRRPHHGPYVGAHRVSWELLHGPIPAGMSVCHHCDNPPCCNDAHHFLGTPADNNLDMFMKGRCRGWSNAGQRRHTNARLSVQKVREIRALYATGLHTQRAIADSFGVCHQNISMIVRCQRWTG